MFTVDQCIRLTIMIKTKSARTGRPLRCTIADLRRWDEARGVSLHVGCMVQPMRRARGMDRLRVDIDDEGDIHRARRNAVREEASPEEGLSPPLTEKRWRRGSGTTQVDGLPW